MKRTHKGKYTHTLTYTHGTLVYLRTTTALFNVHYLMQISAVHSKRLISCHDQHRRCFQRILTYIYIKQSEIIWNSLHCSK